MKDIDPAALRKKSPRAPSISLDEAIDRVMKVYDKEKRHAAPTDVVAQDIGYKNASNGAALSALASLRYYGLLDRPEDGMLSVSKDVENYRYAPDPGLKQELLRKWLLAPSVFSELIEKYPHGLPSDANLRYVLINSGFNPVSAEAVLTVFKRSVDFADYFKGKPSTASAAHPESESIAVEQAVAMSVEAPAAVAAPVSSVAGGLDGEGEHDKIPVRLSGGRKAWLVIPTPFFEADKKRLKAQIDLLLAQDEEAG